MDEFGFMSYLAFGVTMTDADTIMSFMVFCLFLSHFWVHLVPRILSFDILLKVLVSVFVQSLA